jgi:antitoxin (DNA-binding transcriptional repressor) of toxin-antitoxin stability system
MKTEIGACDARTRLPELLRQVKLGKRFTITDRGEAIADLVPSEVTHAPDAAAAINRFLAFMRENPVAPHGTSVKALIDEGRERPA